MAASRSATTYYVRTDGGDARQCTGRADASYPGSGDARDCAWASPMIALPASGAARMSGGDILSIAPGSYAIDQAMQPVPSGPSATSPTRIVGKPGVRLIGINGVHDVLSLDGSSNVEVGNLEITDRSDCVYKHSNPSAACTDAMAWAQVGVYARRSRNVWLHDLDIHGMAALGLNAGGLTDWTLERIKLNRNGRAGWDGNVGTGGSNAGRIIIRGLEVGWNGCGERVATGEPWACWAQKTGGYGDGVGTTDTGGKWLIEDAFIHHNTSDGLDLRYMDGADTSSVTLRRIEAVANAGNQVKVKGNVLIEDSVLVGYCSFFRDRFFMTDQDLCRADGSTLQLVFTGNDIATVRRNTIAGEGAVQIGHSEGDASDSIVMRDNVVVGFPYFRDPASPSAFNGGKSPAARTYVDNIGWNVRKCPADTDCRTNPKLGNMTLAAFDARPSRGSAVVDKAGAAPCSVGRAAQPRVP
ncbi:hypothetical protein [Lysobacter solisilvae (ex Woo and Kim 2020)]|uniref:Right-handed parallel beta-helix repeat-containing protein n=1 Tax=Agrilutibacter terrestris TaxID=2865112 RepID=A0A7H0FXC7_9GAMM|nr:hypothetical protein [Lysobacter terrestris]QNP40693.1 hypothetical protein H8B22_00010 [Lysobacter terrestris]